MLVLLLLLTLSLPASAKLANTFEQNRAQYGDPIKLEHFPSKKGFTGYATYNLDKDWKLKAFYIDDKVRTEHMVPQEKAEAKLSRSEVRDLAMTMFAPVNRGSYRRKYSTHRVEGHFFDKGLIAYEYFIVEKRTLGYRSVKVLFYENNQNFSTINHKAYL